MTEFAAFFRAHYSLMVSVAEHRLLTPGAAEETVSAAFRLAWQRQNTGGELTLSWLYGVVRNLVGSENRRRARHLTLQSRLEEEAAITAHLDGDDNSAEVRAALASLATEHREILAMSYWEELTAQEIGEIRGVTTATVRAHLFRARHSLKALLRSAPVAAH